MFNLFTNTDRLLVTRHCLLFSILFIVIAFSSLTTNAFAAQQEDTVNTNQEQNDPSAQKSEENQEGSEDGNKDATANSEEASDSKTSHLRSNIDIVAPVNALTTKKNDLKHYLAAEIIQPVLVGPEDHTTLVTTNNAINNKGVMILLPDWQQTAASPKALNALRKSFPDQGWTTISVQPPNKPENYPSYAIEQTARDEENSKTLSDYQQQLAKIIAAVTENAKGYPGIILVVAEGHHAALLLNIYQEALAEKPTAFIMLSAHLNDIQANVSAAKNLSLLELPVLDLYLKADNPLVMSSMKLRKKFVNQELKSNYRQKKIYNTHTGYYPTESLIKEINGWLKSIGW